MQSLVHRVDNLQQTMAFGAALAAALHAGSVVALEGPLGAGKTHLVQGVASGCGIDPRDVTSPTFVLINEYRGRRNVYHFDAYRIADDDEFLNLGPDEYFEGDGITLVEWASRVQNCLPRERLEVHIQVLGETSREFQIQAIGTRYEQVIASLGLVATPGETPD